MALTRFSNPHKSSTGQLRSLRTSASDTGFVNLRAPLRKPGGGSASSTTKDSESKPEARRQRLV
ncbi:NAC domain-containing protein 8-like [Pyrus ussuriensis x Pyrus communis]|uniref:NAC domain-containing protein 8-like n=1 Tax=Pyrus ussuriensis x Pyrus communis TaxID=2448454 RepID=A0A5N5G2U7_9ROSA|nr:NAC domain-containing protein 8-like [Pyrus ussuriensis x Pyrus communis]KAB2610156.1 NAC domain-containing protein 8-like [Pyrus ussuriensis x Pyrus communis]